MRTTLGRVTVLMLALAASLPPGVAHAADPTIPQFWDAKERLPKPDLSALPRLRFLTTTDFPPFNFLGDTGRLSGFHVDLARAICKELEIPEKCQIQALPWTELEQALDGGEGEAIIAGLAVTARNRERYAFSRSFLQFPARFVTPKADALSEPLDAKLDGKRVGVVAGSAHERMLRDYFPKVKVVAYDRREWMLDDLKQRKLAAVFGDGMRLAFWLAGTEAAACCRYSGGPYLSQEYLGRGLAIAVTHDNESLARAFDYALGHINSDGTFAEIYLRYFPVSFY